MRRDLLLPFLLCFALQLGLSLHLQSANEKRNEPLFVVPSPEYVKYISGTFRPFLAHVFFMKGVLELPKNTSEKMEYLFELFNAAVQLDPKLVTAVFMGGIVLPIRPGDYPRAIAFLEEARRLSPHEWRIPYWIGFNYAQLENYEKAVEYYRQASLFTGSPGFLKTNQLHLLGQSKNLENSIVQAQQLMESVDDEETRELVLERIAWMQQMLMLEQKVKEFRTRTGAWPTDLNELVSKGLIPALPEDKFGHGFYLEKNQDRPEEVHVKSLM